MFAGVLTFRCIAITTQEWETLMETRIENTCLYFEAWGQNVKGHVSHAIDSEFIMKTIKNIMQTFKIKM